MMKSPDECAIRPLSCWWSWKLKLWYWSLCSAASNASSPADCTLNAWLTSDLRAVEEQLFMPGSSCCAIDDYFENSSPIRDADDIAVPLLAIHYEDDPLVPGPTLPLDLFSLYPHVFLLSCPTGGHCGAVQKLLSATSLAEDAAAGFVDEITQLIDPHPGQVGQRRLHCGRGERLNADHHRTRDEGVLKQRSLRTVGFHIRSTC